MMEYIYFNSRDELLRLRVTEIAYFESDGNYCNVVTANKLRSPIGMNLTNLEHALDKQLATRPLPSSVSASDLSSTSAISAR